MTLNRILPLLLAALVGGASISHAAVCRRPADDEKANTLALDPRPVATDFARDNIDDSAGADVMKKKAKKKKKKKKKSKAS